MKEFIIHNSWGGGRGGVAYRLCLKAFIGHSVQRRGGGGRGGLLIVCVRDESQGTASRGRGKRGDSGERKRPQHVSAEVHELYFRPEAILSVPRGYGSDHFIGHVNIFIVFLFIDRNGARSRSTRVER